MCRDSEIENELKKHPGIGALVNEKTGQVHVFAAPVPYFGLTPAERTALETERDDLLASMPTLPKRERRRAEDRVRRIESDLRRARSADESGRRTIEREAERPEQRYGQPGNSSPATVTEAVASAVEAVNAVVGSTPAKNKLTWASLRADLDAKTVAANRSAVCCSGPKQYWCARCRSKATA
jgi:hypothetical protein